MQDLVAQSSKRGLKLQIANLKTTLSNWRPGNPFPYQIYADSAKLYAESIVRAVYAQDNDRRAQIQSGAQELKILLSSFSTAFYDHLRNRWSGYLNEVVDQVTIPLSRWSTIWAELFENRRIIDSGVFDSPIFDELSTSWNEFVIEIEANGRTKIT